MKNGEIEKEKMLILIEGEVGEGSGISRGSQH